MNARESNSTETLHGKRATASGSASVRNGANRLRDIAERIEGFLAEQIGRLEETMEGAPDAPPPVHMARRTTQYVEEERRRWETEKQRERERIQSDGVRLAEAWQRVEMEQRRLLAQRSAMGSSPVESREPPLAPGDSAADLDAVSPVARQHHGPAAADLVPVMDEPPLTPESAILQFQQLRREMQQHSRRENAK